MSEAVAALALAAARFGMSCEDTRRYCQPSWSGLTHWGDPIPNGNDVKDFILARGHDPHALTREDAKQAESILRERRLKVPEVKMSVFRIEKSHAIRLLEATGLKNAKNYDEKRLLTKLRAYDEIEEDKRDSVDDPALCKLQAQLMTAITRADDIELSEAPVVEDVEKPAKKPKKNGGDRPAPEPAREEPEAEPLKDDKPKKAGKPVKKANPDEDDEPEKNPAKKLKSGEKKINKAGGRGVGINTMMLDMLREASKDKPITKDKIHAKLVKAFPDRDPDAMRGTVNYYIPGYFTRGNYVIGSSDKGFWMAKDKPKKK